MDVLAASVHKKIHRPQDLAGKVDELSSVSQEVFRAAVMLGLETTMTMMAEVNANVRELRQFVGAGPGMQQAPSSATSPSSALAKLDITVLVAAVREALTSKAALQISDLVFSLPLTFAQRAALLLPGDVRPKAMFLSPSGTIINGRSNVTIVNTAAFWKDTQNDLKETHSREMRKLVSLLGGVGTITPSDAVFKATFFDVR